MEENSKASSRGVVRMWQKEFLDETVAHFNRKNRAYNALIGTCVYDHSVNGGCAIGRKCSPKLASSLLQKEPVMSAMIFKRLPNKLKRLGRNFLQRVQALHDNTNCWGDEGLSYTGKNFYSRICEEFNLN